MATHLRTPEPSVVDIAATVAALPSFPSLVAVTRVHVCAAMVAPVSPNSTGVATMGSEHFSADVGEVVGMTVCHLDPLNVVATYAPLSKHAHSRHREVTSLALKGYKGLPRVAARTSIP